MVKRRLQPQTPSVKRRWTRFFLWVFLLILIALAATKGGVRWSLPWSSPGYRTLDELLALQKYRGFELVQEPDRPGPYKEMAGAMRAGKGEPVIGSFVMAGHIRHINVPGSPLGDIQVVGLAPEGGGEPTYMVLRARSAVRK